MAGTDLDRHLMPPAPNQSRGTGKPASWETSRRPMVRMAPAGLGARLQLRPDHERRQQVPRRQAAVMMTRMGLLAGALAR